MKYKYNTIAYWKERAREARRRLYYAVIGTCVCLALALVAIILLVTTGCTPSTSPTARVATDWDVWPASGMDDENPYYFGPGFDDWTIVKESEQWWHITSATYAFACQARVCDDVVDCPGITFFMTPACLYDFEYYGLTNKWDGTGTFEARTGPNGKAITTVTLNGLEPFEGVGSILNFKFEMCKRDDLGWKRGYAVFAQREDRYSSESGGLANWCSHSAVNHFVGTHGQYIPASTCFDSGVEMIPPGDIELMPEEQGDWPFDPNAPPPQPDPKPDIRDLPLTAEEQFWINIDPNILPETAMALYDDNWYQAKRTDLVWYSKKPKFVYPLNWESLDERYNIVDNSHPYFCSLLVELSERCDISQITIPAKCNGYDINLYPVAMAAHGRNIVVRSDYIVTCDTDSTGGAEEDLYGNKHVCIPIEPGDKLHVTIPDNIKLLFLSEKWLHDSRLFDINNSGSVDYHDFLEMLK